MQEINMQLKADGSQLNLQHGTKTTTTTVLWLYVRYYASEPVPEETFTHSHLS